MSATVHALPVPEPRNHAPSGRPSWPRFLLSGDEGARKSWKAAEFSADQRLGTMFWLEIGSGESTAEEYGAIPNVNYRIIDHDGTFADLYGQLRAHKALAQQAEDAGEPPHPLAVDSFTGLWTGLTKWADIVARRREQTKAEKFGKRVRSDLWSPEYEPQITPDLWNLVNRRWNLVLHEVKTWPGPVVYTAREKLVTQFQDNGQPDPKAPKVWTLEAQKGLGFDSTVWIRLTRGDDPQIVKMRSVREGVIRVMQAADKKPVREWSLDELSLAHITFDVIGCEAGVSRAPETKDLDADQVLPGEQATEASAQQQRDGGGQQRQAPPARAAGRRTRQQNQEWAAAGAVKMAAASTAEEMAELIAKAQGDPTGTVDVSGALSPAQRAELAIEKGDAITLNDLGALALAYVEANGYSVDTGVKVAAEQLKAAS